MKYFGSIVLLCIFQWIQFSDACYGHKVEVVEVECGKNNNIKIEKDYSIEVTDDCRVNVSGYLTIDKPFNSATISLKGSTSFINGTVFKNKDFCKVLSVLNVKMECPITKSGRVHVELEKPFDISQDYGPMLAFAVGQVYAAAKITYDGDEANSDIFAFVANITTKHDDFEWIF